MIGVDNSFGGRLRRHRHRNGWTQAELARKAGLREQQIVRWENNQNQPRLEHVVVLAETLEVETGELLASDEDEEDTVAGPLSRDEYALFGELTARILAAKAAA